MFNAFFMLTWAGRLPAAFGLPLYDVSEIDNFSETGEERQR